MAELVAHRTNSPSLARTASAFGQSSVVNTVATAAEPLYETRSSCPSTGWRIQLGWASQSTFAIVGRYRHQVPPGSGRFHGGAVLVHGLWGNPDDWRWVRRPLEDAHVQVITPDLPSHRTPMAGLIEDAAEVRDAIRACAPPVAAVGWSYGGSVIGVAATGDASVSRLVYVNDIPRPAGFPAEHLGWIDADPHVLVLTDGRFVPDNEYWLNEGDGTTFPAEIRRHFRNHPRRPVTRATLGARPEAAWETTPTSVLIGDRDNLLPDGDRKWARDHLDDIRVINTDHFIIFRHPEVVAQLVLEAIGRTLDVPDRG